MPGDRIPGKEAPARGRQNVMSSSGYKRTERFQRTGKACPEKTASRKQGSMRGETVRGRLKQAGYAVLSRRFFLRSPGEVAKGMLGKYLVRSLRGTLLIGRIVEVEAYYGEMDPASHAHRGMTNRNKVMFDVGGKAYIYLAYGNHFLVNLVAGKQGTPGAVLIRAVEPVEGIAEMARRRKTADVSRLTSGPGRLTKAFGIHGKLTGCDVTDSELLTCYRIGERKPLMSMSPRIGIRRGTELRERYYIPGNPFISGKPNR
jgi:DNA-3-methyladenine glycosylase